MSNKYILDYEGEGYFIFSTKTAAINWVIRQEQARTDFLQEAGLDISDFNPEDARDRLNLIGDYDGIWLHEIEEEDPKDDINWEERYR